MIGFFPDPYPDELLYSICARYSDRVRYSNKGAIAQELFGSAGAAAVVDLPTYLGHLVAALPPGHCYTVDRLIDCHTLLPFYSPFLPIERVYRLREDMMKPTGSGIHQYSGVTPSNIYPPKWLRFCPVCTQGERKQLGESYWHRLHQIPGVEVCPDHAVFLEISCVPTRNRVNDSHFFSAEQSIHTTLPRSLDLSDRFHQFFLKIAHDTAWLIRQSDLVPGYAVLRDYYHYLLANHGLASYIGRVHVKKLKKAFNNYYSLKFLKLLQCEVDEDKDSNWLSRLVKDLSIPQAHHPLRHLLLIQFLGYTAEEFFKVSLPSKPFGEGSWPCLNQASDHFGELLIENCKIKIDCHQRQRPIGIFSCSYCAFTYSRTGPDISPEDIFRITTRKSYGPVWESALKNLWEDPSVSFNEMERRLGADESAILRQAARSGLTFPRLGPRGTSTRLSKEVSHSKRSSPATNPEKLEDYRSQWLSIREQNPELGRTALSNKFKRIHSWLRDHDSEWLETHQPLPEKCGGIRRIVDWSSRDAEFAEAVKLSASRLKSIPGRPVQITRAAIGKELHQKALLEKFLDRLPLTANVLTEIVETREDFAVRRVECTP